jgi:hypothetical protein
MILSKNNFTTDNILAHSPHSPLGQHLLARSFALTHLVDAKHRHQAEATLGEQSRGGAAAADDIGRAAGSPASTLRRFSRAHAGTRTAADGQRLGTRSDRARFEKTSSDQRSRHPGPGNLQTSSFNFLLFFSLQQHLHIIVALAHI